MSLAFAKAVSARLWNDQHGFIVSAELMLIATIGVLTMVVGLSEVAFNINNELEDVGSAFGKMSQSYSMNGTKGHKGSSEGSQYKDGFDFCDGDCDIQPGSTQSEY